MNKLNKIYKFIDFLAIAVSTAIAQYTIEIAKQKFENHIMLFVIALAIITIGYAILPIILQLLIEKSFLKRLILGNEYIEGTYIDLMRKNGKPIDVSISRIKIGKDKIRYGGNDYSLTENGLSGIYHASLIELNFPSMRYTYNYKLGKSDSALLYGYGELDFDERDGEPLLYTGHYIDLTSKEKVTFEGWKIKDKATLKKLDNPKERLATIKAYFDLEKE